MKIQNSGYVPGSISSTYTGKKAETAAIGSDSRTNAAKLDKVSVPTAKLDTIEISRHSVSSRPTMAQTRDTILAGLEQDKDAAHLDALKEQIRSGQYKVDSGELAKILLSGRPE